MEHLGSIGPDALIVLHSGLVSGRSAFASLIPRLVEVRLGYKNERLEGHQHLKTRVQRQTITGNATVAVAVSVGVFGAWDAVWGALPWCSQWLPPQYGATKTQHILTPLFVVQRQIRCHPVALLSSL